MTEALLHALEIVGIFAFAVTGALVGVRRDLDAFGVTVLALLTGLGGGVLRDVLIGATPPTALREWPPITTALVAALVVVVWHRRIGRRDPQILVFDALGLGLFCVSGTIVAAEAGLAPWAAALMGVITSIGGGILRDVLAGRIPVVLQRDLYATPAALGAVVAAATWRLDLTPLLYVVAAASCVTWRLLAVRRDWSAPRPWAREA
ncbi:MAG: TRIC cation channel family protein [Aeromicrobium erythreum]